MAKAKDLQGNFSAGVLDPAALGRVDIARYPNAAKVLKNVISRTLGGAKKRPGLGWVKETKDSTKKSRLIPYIISKDVAYMLEVGEYYIRIYTPDGLIVGAPYEITTPYTEQQTQDFDYSQGEDAMYLFHNSVYPYRLRRFADQNWNLATAPFTATPFDEVGAYYAVALTLSANTVGTGRTMTAGSAVFLAADVGRAIIWNGGIAIITGYTSTTVVTVTVVIVFDSTAIPSGLWNMDASPMTTCTPDAFGLPGTTNNFTLGAAGWRADDVGKYIRINGGLVLIITFTSTTVVVARVINQLSSAAASPSLAWTLEGSVWNTNNGYPRTGTFYEQRLVAAGNIKSPQTIWGSRTGEPLDFTIGVNDDDAFSYTLAGDDNQVNQINYLVTAKRLLALTFGGEFSIYGGVEKPVTPTNVQIDAESPHGADTVRPVQVQKETLFVQRAGLKLRAMGYAASSDSYASPDLTTLAESITRSGIASIAFQQEPDPVVWIALKSGRLISVTLDRELDVIAWNTHETDGAVESIAVLPYGSEEQVWMIVRRSINGSIVRYVERFVTSWYPLYGTAIPDPNIFPPGDYPVDWGYTLDCAITLENAVAQTVWTGLDHLEGKTVRVIADGYATGDLVVTAGSITLEQAANRILVGLLYRPVITLLTPELQMGTGSIQADALSTNEVVIRVVNTVGATVNGDPVLFGRIFGPAQLDTPPELFTGDKSISTIGWSKGKAEVTISQDDAFPFHLLAVIRSITANGG